MIRWMITVILGTVGLVLLLLPPLAFVQNVQAQGGEKGSSQDESLREEWHTKLTITVTRVEKTQQSYAAIIRFEAKRRHGKEEEFRTVASAYPRLLISPDKPASFGVSSTRNHKKTTCKSKVQLLNETFETNLEGEGSSGVLLIRDADEQGLLVLGVLSIFASGSKNKGYGGDHARTLPFAYKCKLGTEVIAFEERLSFAPLAISSDQRKK